ncbi:hypothetical protein [Oscillatoria acuminata]|uniref:hypothetical protein n=1 Tax=Oscillatoria acuminata TaxID=118323 RepID=UPI0012EA13BC|nr:hypothetical protein [Oscillatoria acuminata]
MSSRYCTDRLEQTGDRIGVVLLNCYSVAYSDEIHLGSAFANNHEQRYIIHFREPAL